jgi:hypothetical protein
MRIQGFCDFGRLPGNTIRDQYKPLRMPRAVEPVAGSIEANESFLL